MKVSDALDSRITCRAFLPDPVPEQVVREILEGAARAPSGGNLQPWWTWVLAGERLQAFRTEIQAKMAQTPQGEPPEYHVYPPDLKEPYRTRRYKCGEDLYATIDIPRSDKPARLRQLAKNFDFFGAPVALFFAIDRNMQQGQWADLGMYLQSVMLLAREHGLHTCPQEAWARWPQTVGGFLKIPPELMLFCGMGLGRMDESHPINTLRTDRASLAETVQFSGF